MNMNSMVKIRIGDNTTTDEVRRQLSDFSRFSKVEASTEEVGEKKIVVLHEVTLGQRLGRLFQSPRQRSDSADRSRKAMRALADTHPVIGNLLGTSINHKSGWSVTELRETLTSGLVRMAPTEHGKKLAVPLAERGQVGVANATIADIESDSKVFWQFRPANISFPTTVSEPSNECPFVEVSVFHPDTPSVEDMTDAYRRAFKAASGHIVIAPIKHVDEGVKQSCSDRSILLLLEAIDNAKQTNLNLTAVTIAAGEYGDTDLAGRIEDLQATRRLAANESSTKSEHGRFFPPHGRQVPGRAGIHFLTNSPFTLQAGRTVIPLSVAQSNGYAYVNEGDVSAFPKLDTGRLIALDDRRIDQVNGGSPENFFERFSQLLQNMAGTVVIYPPPLANKEQLQAMMSAVIDSCEKNQSLSVSFATEDADQRKALTNAFVAAKQARQDAQELDIDADPEEEIIVFADLWKKA
jgi:hypothetical protein